MVAMTAALIVAIELVVVSRKVVASGEVEVQDDDLDIKNTAAEKRILFSIR